MVEINNLTKVKVDEVFLKRVAKKVLKGENKEVDISIALVGEKKIKSFNKKYRKKDEATDVLSFGEGLNEIVICPRKAKDKKALAEILVHGILHLLNYSHGAEMDKKQNKYLNNQNG